jgi:predicted transcriptional regulator
MNETEKKARPHIERVRMPDGTVRLLGVTAAARYLGRTQQAVSQYIRGKTPAYALNGPLARQMREEYPELVPECERAGQDGSARERAAQD